MLPWADSVALALDALVHHPVSDGSRACEVKCSGRQPLGAPGGNAGLDRDRLITRPLVTVTFALGIGYGAWLLARTAVVTRRGRQ